MSDPTHQPNPDEVGGESCGDLEPGDEGLPLALTPAGLDMGVEYELPTQDWHGDQYDIVDGTPPADDPEDPRLSLVANAIGYAMFNDGRPTSDSQTGVAMIEVTDEEAARCKIAAARVLAHLDAATGPPQVLQFDEPQPVKDLNALTGALCEAVGLDPAECAGFRLTVSGGAFPALEEFKLAPHRKSDGQLVDEWSAPLSGRMADTTHVILPGASSEIPQAVARYFPVELAEQLPVRLHPEVWLIRHLPQVLDAMNGAPLPADERDALTMVGHQIVAGMQDRVYGYGMPQPITARGPLPELARLAAEVLDTCDGFTARTGESVYDVVQDVHAGLAADLRQAADAADATPPQ